MGIKIELENIQSIKKAKLNIEEHVINIKYGYNGLGKSSIGKAIDYHVNDLKDEFTKLQPFVGGVPSISIPNIFDSCMSFNRDYINKWLFQGNENLINESYSIFFNDPALVKKTEEINASLLNLLKNAKSNELSLFVDKVNKISSQLKFNKDKKTISGTSTVGKGFKNGPAYAEKITKSDLKEYSKWINNPKSPEWFSWFKTGSGFVFDDECPFCSQEFPDNFSLIKAKILSVFKDNDFKKNNIAKQIIIDLSTISENSIRSSVESINTLEEQLSNEQQELLAKVFNNAEKEKNKIEYLINQNRFSIRSITSKEKIRDLYKEKRLNVEYFKGLSEELYNSAELVNKSIDKLLKEFDEFYGLMEDFDTLLGDSISNAKEEINTFLKYAGIPYVFNLEVDEFGNSITTLKPKDNDKMVLEDVTNNLSYGEVNVLSLALFGAIAKRKETDLIILDDPISSFDENKKFAVIHFLFNEKNGVLNGKTVILLTHDMEPLLDIIKNNFIHVDKKAYLLTNSKGIVTEKEIKKEEIQNVIIAEHNLAKTNSIDYLKIIHLRRYYELLGTSHNSPIYQILSNAEHLRATPIDRNNIPLDEKVLCEGIDKIQKEIIGFDYSNFIAKNTLKDLITIYKQSNDNYEKIRIIRPILDNNTIDVDSKLRNFITENYHVENLYLYTIMGIKQVPDYIIDLCDCLIKEIEEKSA